MIKNIKVAGKPEVTKIKERLNKSIEVIRK